MKYASNKRFLEAMAGIKEAFCQGISDSQLKIYAVALEDIPIAEIEKACWYLIKTRTTASLPKVAEIREAVKGSDSDRAALAITRIEKAWYDGVDIDRNVDFGDPILHQVIVNAGGWASLCNLTDREWRFVKKDLERQYNLIMNIPSAYFNSPDFLPGRHGDIVNIEKLKSRGLEIRITKVDRNGKQKQISLTRYTDKQKALSLPEVKIIENKSTQEKICRH